MCPDQLVCTCDCSIFSWSAVQLWNISNDNCHCSIPTIMKHVRLCTDVRSCPDKTILFGVFTVGHTERSGHVRLSTVLSANTRCSHCRYYRLFMNHHTVYTFLKLAQISQCWISRDFQKPSCQPCENNYTNKISSWWSLHEILIQCTWMTELVTLTLQSFIWLGQCDANINWG